MNTGVMRGSEGQYYNLPSSRRSTEDILHILFTESLPAGLSGVGNNDRNTEMREPISRIIQAFGNTRNPDNFVQTQGQINGMKGQIMGFSSPMSDTTFLTTLEDAATGLDSASTETLLTTFRFVRTAPDPIHIYRN
jgi:hypothetical protein